MRFIQCFVQEAQKTWIKYPSLLHTVAPVCGIFRLQITVCGTQKGCKSIALVKKNYVLSVKLEGCKVIPLSFVQCSWENKGERWHWILTELTAGAKKCIDFYNLIHPWWCHIKMSNSVIHVLTYSHLKNNQWWTQVNTLGNIGSPLSMVNTTEHFGQHWQPPINDKHKRPLGATLAVPPVNGEHYRTPWATLAVPREHLGQHWQSPVNGEH